MLVGDLNVEMNTASAVDLQLQVKRMYFEPLWTKFEANRILRMYIC